MTVEVERKFVCDAEIMGKLQDIGGVFRSFTASHTHTHTLLIFIIIQNFEVSSNSIKYPFILCLFLYFQFSAVRMINRESQLIASQLKCFLYIMCL